ncbi:MAG: ferredoxin [Candidatus Colwellbacteria bacterium]|nr:ferredoxin [Candidatus Colwellbacteria bacterium]
MDNNSKNPPSPEDFAFSKLSADKSAGKEKPLKIGKIVVDRNLCIGAASCIAVAPGVFELDSENKAVVYNDKGADDETILLAAQSCPTQAILLFDEEGNQIFP